MPIILGTLGENEMKRALPSLIKLCALFFLYSALAHAEKTVTSHSTAQQIVYSCVPHRIWDNGYNVKIVFDSLSDGYLAMVYSVSFFGETLLFQEPVTLKVERPENKNDCVLRFMQTLSNASHHLELYDIGHRYFDMKLVLYGSTASKAFSHLDCLIDKSAFR